MPTQKSGTSVKALILKCTLTKSFSPKRTAKHNFQFAFLGVLIFSLCMNRSLQNIYAGGSRVWIWVYWFLCILLSFSIKLG